MVKNWKNGLSRLAYEMCSISNKAVFHLALVLCIILYSKQTALLLVVLTTVDERVKLQAVTDHSSSSVV
jgi:hypothetical protein